MVPSNFFHKPELALRHAMELVGISQFDAALEILHDVLSSRRHRTWSPIFEQIMLAYLDLCIQQFKSREAKDGLHQYRNLSQSNAPGSLEKVITYLIQKAEAACASVALAAAASADTSTTTTPDADSNNNTSLIATHNATTFSGLPTTKHQQQQQQQRDVPALKFLWETYRAVLDILRSNSKLERVYHKAAVAALQYCRTYQAKSEFRHLCDMLRMHLGNLRHATDGSGGEKQQNKVRRQ